MRDIKTVFGFDFDKTGFYTFAFAGGMGVPEAYQQAIIDIWGEEGFKALGKFDNQAPIQIGEIIQMGIGRESFVARAQEYYIHHKSQIDAVMPADVGASIEFVTGNILNAAVDVLVRRKLEFLMPNIGKTVEDGLWPLPTKNYSKFWRACSEFDGAVTAIISSGHDVFIRKVFELHGLPQPDIIVSDDHMRRRKLRLYKPHAGIWSEVLSEVRALGYQPARSIYFGDSRVEDGGLAHAAMIDFQHFADSQNVWHGHAGTFDNWDRMMHLVSC